MAVNHPTSSAGGIYMSLGRGLDIGVTASPNAQVVIRKEIRGEWDTITVGPATKGVMLNLARAIEYAAEHLDTFCEETLSDGY